MGAAAARLKDGTGAFARTLALLCAVLAVLLQANAPVQAAMMAAGSDLPANLCASHAPGQDHRSPADRDAACAACAVCVAAATTAVLSEAPALPIPASVTLAVPPERAWISVRGPPLRAARARGPPLVV